MKPSKGTSSTRAAVTGVPQVRALLLAEGLSSTQLAHIQTAAAACRLELHVSDMPQHLVHELDAVGAELVLLSVHGPSAQQVCASVRRLRGRRVALVGISNQLGGVAFNEFVSYGGDDVMGADSERALEARVRSIRDAVARASTQTSPRRPAEDQRFLLIAPAASEMLAGARLIQQSGHQAAIVQSTEEGLDRLSVGRAVRVVIDTRVAGALEFADRALQQESCAGVVLACPPQELGQLGQRYAEDPRVAVIDAYSPADAVLFAANEVAGRLASRRSTERLLYSTTIDFRDAGGEFDHLGCTFNISAGGVYVRTLVQPVSDRVWLELTPPGSVERVRLEGRVAWRTQFGQEGSVPVGFGVEVQDGSTSSLNSWRVGYRSLEEKLRIVSGHRTTFRAPGLRASVAMRPPVIEQTVSLSGGVPPAGTGKAAPSDEATKAPSVTPRRS